MTHLQQFKDWVWGGSKRGSGPRIIVFGDSHTAALTRAKHFRSEAKLFENIEIVRFKKDKGSNTLGDMSIEDFCRTIRGLGTKDFVFSAVGGNQYAIISTVQSPLGFDFLTDPADDDVASERDQLIPSRTLVSYVESGVRGTDGPTLEQIRRSTRARVFHLFPPPPKEDNAFISRYFETRFVDQGIEQLGPARPRLRLKCWKVQAECLKLLCEDLDIIPVLPPAATTTGEGFLIPSHYAKDVTHANRRYGEEVLRQITDLVQANGQDGRK